MKNEYFENPADAYDRLAPAYASFAQRREAYLRSAEAQVIARIHKGANSLLDIGAGDGMRSMRIAAAVRITRVVMVEPSTAMAELSENSAEVWRIGAEHLNAESIAERFDVVTCLWNVLGHVNTAAKRAGALSTAAQLVSPGGKLFLDVNHRYNARSYGWLMTCARWVRDKVSQDPQAGDVIATWNIAGSRISTYGHVFTNREIAILANAAGLEIEDRVVIDYDTGALHQFPWLGNLLYIFRRSSRRDSSSAPATS